MAKILIAIPQQSVRDRFVEALSPDGHTFAHCPDGRSVREEVARGLPDLVVTDVDLPGLDAFELVRLVQETAVGGRGTPLIVIGSGTAELAPDISEGAGFTWMGLSPHAEDLREMVRARLVAGGDVRRRTILVVDDDRTIRESLDARLRLEGYGVITALDGVEALERLAGAPDLVLVDVEMPRLDGFGLLERMQTEPRFRDIPVIVVTAQAKGAEAAARGLRLGARDYVRKPFIWEELSARVQTQLRIRDAHRLTVEKQRDLAIIELAGAAPHEINNPLAVVIARLELLLSGKDESHPLQEDLKTMEHLVHRIAGVVDKMSQVRHYQVRNYCGDVNILDLDRASAPDDEGPPH